MRTITVLGLGLLGLFYALPAQALTISNTDAEPRTFTVTAGGDSSEVTIEPQASAEPACASGCTLEVDSGEQYEMEGGEVVAIEDGNLFVDAVPAQ